MTKILSLFGFLAFVFFISGVSSAITAPAIESWYLTLNKPAWTPPNRIFAPVWAVLYLMIAVSGWIIWNHLPVKGFIARLDHPSMRMYWLQLIFNFMWSVMFFGIRNPVIAIIDITLLVIAIACTIEAFYRISRTAAWMLVPYLLWVFYAAALNFAIVAIN